MTKIHGLLGISIIRKADYKILRSTWAAFVDNFIYIPFTYGYMGPIFSGKVIVNLTDER